MKTIKTLKPGQPGTKRWLKKYGDRLVFVRYRVDQEKRKKFTTVEIVMHVVENYEKKGGFPLNRILPLKINYEEIQLRNLIKKAGGHWNSNKKVWELSYKDIKALGLESRIVEEA